MKLGIVTAYPPSKVTLNEYAYYLVKHFRQHTQLTELIIYTDSMPQPKDYAFEEVGCKVTFCPSWGFNSYTNVFTLRKAIKTTKPDFLLYNLQFMKFGDRKVAAALGLLMPWISKLMGIPTVVLLHNIMETVDLSNAGFTSNMLKAKIFKTIGNALTRMILKADVVAVTMQSYVDILTKKYKAKNVVHIPHGTFEIPEKPDFVTGNYTYKVMTFGKFGTYKKVEVLIEAVAKIRQQIDLDISLVIAGTDNPNTPGYLASVAQKYSHVPQLEFTGYVQEADVPRLFQESTVVAFPYTSTTGSSGVLHQAGSYGKAVVMPDLGDLSILVKDEGYQGAFFTPDDSESLAVAITELLIDKPYREAMEIANYKAATALPMSEIADRYVNQFKQLIGTEQQPIPMAA